MQEFVANASRTITEGGTEAYLAPEVWNGTSHHSSPFKLDVWALGVILYALTHGELPFQKPDKETIDRIQKHGMQFNEDTSTSLRNAISAMLTPDPNKRISVNNVKNDKWLRRSMPWQKRLSVSEENLRIPEDDLGARLPHSNSSGKAPNKHGGGPPSLAASTDSLNPLELPINKEADSSDSSIRLKSLEILQPEAASMISEQIAYNAEASQAACNAQARTVIHETTISPNPRRQRRIPVGATSQRKAPSVSPAVGREHRPSLK